MVAVGGRPKVFVLLDTHVVSGPAKGLFQFLDHADRSRFEFLIGAFKYQNPRSVDFLEAVRARGLPLSLVTQRHSFDPGPLRSAVETVRSQGCTIIQTHGYKSHLIGAWVKFRTGIKWVAVSHGWTAENLKVKLYHLLDHLLLPYADAAVGVAPDMSRTLAKMVRDGSKVHLILNAIDAPPRCEPGSRERIRAEYGIPPDALLLGCIGRFSKEKGQAILLDAFAALRNPSSHLLLVGDGVDAAALTRRVSELGLEQRVHFAGFQRAIGPYYEALDLLVIPSLSEGMPNVLLEAMSLGLPVVCTDVGGVREALTAGESGWLVRAGDSAALYEALDEASNDPEKRRKFAARGKASLFPKFDPRARAERFQELYERLSS